MKHFFLLFIFLNLISSTFTTCHAQELHLSIITASPKQDSIINALKINNTYSTTSALQSALKNFSQTIKEEGYIDFKIEKHSVEDTLYIVKIDLGILYDKMRVYFENPIIKPYLKKLNVEIKDNYFEIDTRSASELLKQLTSFESYNGYPLSVFKLIDFSKNDNSIIAHLTLNRENKRKLDYINIKGYDKFPKSFITHYANLKEGQIFDKKKITTKATLLSELSFVNQKRHPEILFDTDSTTVYFYLEKNQSNSFDGFLGFGSDEDSGNLQLDGYLDLSLHNNLNYGESLILNYKSDGNDQQNLNVELELPFLFSSPVGTEFSLNLFRKDSTFSTSHQQIALFYQINKLRFNAGVEFENSNQLENSAITNNAIEDYKKSLMGAGLSYNSNVRSNILPNNNAFSIYGAYGNRNEKDNEASQFQLKTSCEYNFILNAKNQVNLNNRTNILFSDSYLSNELFRFGGNKSIRGFKENSINANLVSVLRAEYRYQPVNNLYLHTITDAAYFENDILNEEDFIYSLGLGAGLLTSSGLLNISLANGIRKGNAWKFSESILHISLKAYF